MALTDENHLNSPIALSTGQKTHTPTTDHHTTNRRRPLGPLPSPSPAVQFSLLHLWKCHLRSYFRYLMCGVWL